jgi:putative hemin transport protein
MQAEALRDAWQQLLTEQPKTRARDAAEKLGVSEGELVASTVGHTATRLRHPSAELVHALPALGRVMALTRNQQAVSEVRGLYGGVDLDGHVGSVVGEEIDLRVFLHAWQHAFALVDGDKRSLQIFDATGTAVHKIFLEEHSDVFAFEALIKAWSTPEQRPGLEVTTPRPRTAELPDADIDVESFQAGWDRMVDTHDFFHLVRRHALSRRQALRLAGPERARRVPIASLATILERARDATAEIMVFVGNPGVLQVRSGVVNRLLRTGPWFNVMDPGFNLHVREDQLHEGWVVKKPTRSGIVTSLELQEKGGETVVMLFDKRRDRDLEEKQAWRDWLEALS